MWLLVCTYTTLGHRFERPFKHMSHCQQLTPGSIETRSPTLKFLTFVPTSRICPADSWPRIISCVTQQSPILPVFQKWISDPQIPVAFWAGQAHSKWKKEKTDHMDDTRVGWTGREQFLLLPNPCLSVTISRHLSRIEANIIVGIPPPPLTPFTSQTSPRRHTPKTVSSHVPTVFFPHTQTPSPPYPIV
jgi:hypothetical protein